MSDKMTIEISKEKIRPHGIIRPSSTGSAHIPEVIRKELGSTEIPYVMDAHTIILFNPNKNPREILQGLEVLMRDLRLRIEKEKK